LEPTARLLNSQDFRLLAVEEEEEEHLPIVVKYLLQAVLLPE